MNILRILCRQYIFLILLLSGCVTQRMVDEELAKQPEYFRVNVGTVKIEPLSPLSLFFKGYVNSDEEGCPVHLLLLADRDTIREELFHSFFFRQYAENYAGFAKFHYDFYGGGTISQNYNPALVYLLALNIPMIQELPIPGHANLYGYVSFEEDSAGCFTHGPRNDKVLQIKCRAVQKFIQGEYK